MRILSVESEPNRNQRRSQLRRAFADQVSPLALRSTVAAAGMVLGSTMLASPALANCGFPAANDVVCDGTTGGPIPTTGIINFTNVAFVNGQTSSSASGLVVTTTISDNNVSIDATSSISAATTSNALTISASAGNISSTTPYGSGINGTLITTGGDGLNVSNTFAGGDIVLVQGSTGVINGSARGIFIQALGGPGSLINLTVNGRVTGGTGAGVQLNSNDVLLFTSTATISGGPRGVDASSGGNASVQINGGSVTGGAGVWLNAGNGANTGVGLGATVTGTSGNGFEVNAGREVTMINNGRISGATNGFVGTAGALASSASTIGGTGAYVGLGGNAITFTNNSTQATNVTIAGSATATGGNGITLVVPDSDTTVNVSGTILATGNGINGTSNTGDITINVASTGVIDPLIGVNLTTASGALVVNNAGLIEGDQSGVVLNSTGAGAVGNLELNQTGTGITRVTNVGGGAQGVLMTSVDANQIVTGNGANTTINAANGTIAVDMSTTGTGAITITDNTIVGNTGGIRAAQTGAATTGITVNGTGGISTSTGTAVDLNINNAANTGNILYSRTGNVSGAAGINATILSGAGNVTVSPVGNVTATNGNAINATISSFALNNASVLVTTSAGSTITATNGSGITAFNQSDGTGTLTVTNAASIRSSGGLGINAVRGVGDGNTTVTNTGSIASGPSGPNTLQIGIQAFANPGAFGNVTVNQTGANIGSATDRAQIQGITAQSGGSANLGNVTINLSNTSIYAVNNAARAVTNGTGNVSIIGTGTGTLDTSLHTTVLAQKINTGVGNVLVDITQNVLGGSGGIHALTAGSGTVTVFARGTVTATNGIGIHGQATSTGATSLISIDALNTVQGTTGIQATNAGTGSVGVLANANVTGTAGSGIVTALTNAGNQGNSITVTVNPSMIVTGTGAGSSGISTNIGQSTGNGQVVLNGTASGVAAGVTQTSVAGINFTNVGATGRAIGTTAGIAQINIAGSNSVVNGVGGLIQGATGVSQSSTGTATSGVLNGGTITGATWGINATLGGGAYTLTNAGSGIINGPISVTGSNLATSLFSNGGTWNTSAASTFNGTWQNSGITNVAAGSTITVAGPSSNTAAGRINFAGNATLVSNLGNAGLLDARNGTAGQVINQTGNYVGSGGVIGLDVSLATLTADRYNISGTATGTTNVQINLLSQGLIPGGFLPLVTVGTGPTAATAFTSTTPLPTTGLFTATFGVNPANANEFGINQTVNPGGAQLGMLTQLADSVSMMVDDPISTLVTERTERTTQIGIWGRGSAGQFDQTLATSVGALSLSDRVDTSYHTLQSGLDIGLLGMGGGLNLHLGVTGGHWGSSSKMTGGGTTISTDFLGGYVVIKAGGFTLDGNIRREWRDYELTNPTLVASGRAVTKGTATAGAVGASYKASFGGGMFIKPEASYHFGSASTDPFQIDGLTTVTPADDNSSVIRFGGTIGWEGQVSPNLIATPYIGVYGLNASSNTSSTSTNFGISPLTMTTTGFDNTMQVVGGLNMRSTDSMIGAFVRGSAFTSNGVKGASFSVGARINF